MKLVIYKTHKRVQIATAEFTVKSVQQYKQILQRFNIQIDEVDAVKDLLAGEEVALTVPVDQDYALDA